MRRHSRFYFRLSMFVIEEESALRIVYNTSENLTPGGPVQRELTYSRLKVFFKFYWYQSTFQQWGLFNNACVFQVYSRAFHPQQLHVSRLILEINVCFIWPKNTAFICRTMKNTFRKPPMDNFTYPYSGNGRSTLKKNEI